jgi:hypothetical protein
VLALLLFWRKNMGTGNEKTTDTDDDCTGAADAGTRRSASPVEFVDPSDGRGPIEAEPAGDEWTAEEAGYGYGV